MALQFLFKQNTNLQPWMRLLQLHTFCSKVFTVFDTSKPPTINQGRFPSLLHPCNDHSKGFKIELVDDASWHVSSGLSEAWKQMNRPRDRNSSMVEPIDDIEGSSEPEFDDIEDMRFQGTLFYKLDKDSREFGESNVEYPRKKSSKKRKEEPKEKMEKEKTNRNSPLKAKEQRSKFAKVMKDTAPLEEMAVKKERTPTFNQLTAPYHEPFCLDIFISKSSVRACIIHRVTSKVVVVAHSISKDMKFDLKSTKDINACIVVGEILAQRALEDDIHDIVYTPRKGDKIEGKLEMVLQSVIDHGVNVKVKLKQRKTKYPVFSSSRT
ncbi:hypothetical protein ACHQM5_027517 [Ranunculus cassubicifolius]